MTAALDSPCESPCTVPRCGADALLLDDVATSELLVPLRDVTAAAALDSPCESPCTVPRCSADAVLVLLGANTEIADEVKFGDDLVTAADRDAEETVVGDDSELEPVLAMTEFAGERAEATARFLLKSVAKILLLDLKGLELREGLEPEVAGCRSKNADPP